MEAPSLDTVLTVTRRAVLAAYRSVGVFGNSLVITGAYVLTAAPRRFELFHGTEWTRRWAQGLVRGFGLRVEVSGTAPKEGALLIANHRSYVDIAAIGSQVNGCFIARADIVDWPLLGFTFRVSPTLFIDRGNPESARLLREEVMRRLNLGASIINFAEGTTKDGPGLLRFKMGLFKDVFGLPMPIVPVTLTYTGMEHRVEWIGNDTFLGHFLRLAGHRNLTAHLHFLEPLRADGFDSVEDLVWEVRCRMLENLAERETVDKAEYPELSGAPRPATR